MNDILLDTTAMAIVLLGTALATVLRCGFGDTGATLAALWRIVSGQMRFRPEAVRAQMARVGPESVRDGLLRTHVRRLGDAEFDAALDALVGQRSIAACRKVLAQGTALRARLAQAGVETLNVAAELAPVFGLAGTLFSLSKLPANGIDRSAYMAAMGMAVHATLYGLVTANLLLAPLARLVERRHEAEAADRAGVAQWFEHELALAFPARGEFGAASGGDVAPVLPGETGADAPRVARRWRA